MLLIFECRSNIDNHSEETRVHVATLNTEQRRVFERNTLFIDTNSAENGFLNQLKIYLEKVTQFLIIEEKGMVK